MSHCFAERRAEKPMSSMEFVVHQALFFYPHYLLYYHTHTTNFGRKNSDMIKGDRDNNGGGGGLH